MTNELENPARQIPRRSSLGNIPSLKHRRQNMRIIRYPQMEREHRDSRDRFKEDVSHCVDRDSEVNQVERWQVGGDGDWGSQAQEDH